MKNTPLCKLMKIISMRKNIDMEQVFFVNDDYEYDEFASFINHD